MDAEQSRGFCALSSTISSVGQQLHHLRDELPMPCPALVPDLTSLQVRVQPGEPMSSWCVAWQKCFCKHKAEWEQEADPCFRAVPVPEPALCRVETELHIPHGLPSSGLGLHGLCVQRGLSRSYELGYPSPNSTRLCTAPSAAQQTELRLKGHGAPVLALPLPTAAGDSKEQISSCGYTVGTQ